MNYNVGDVECFLLWKLIITSHTAAMDSTMATSEQHLYEHLRRTTSVSLGPVYSSWKKEANNDRGQQTQQRFALFEDTTVPTKKTVKNYENIMVPIFRIFVVNQQFVESSVHLTSTHLFMQGNWIVNAVEKSWGHAFHFDEEAPLFFLFLVSWESITYSKLAVNIWT